MSIFGSPVPIDTFGRYMAQLFDERQVISVPTGFLSFFGNAEMGGVTHFVPDDGSADIEIIRGTKTLAALIPRGGVSRAIGSSKKDLLEGRFSTFNRTFPLVEEEGSISAAQLIHRVAGEAPYSGNSRLTRMRDKALAVHTESIRRIIRLMEYLASQSILTGKMPAILDTTDTGLIYDFKRRAAHTITVDVAWDSESPAPDIFGDIDGACDLIEANGNVQPDFLALGSDVLSAMIKDATFLSLADNRRIEMVQVSEREVPAQYMRYVKSGWTPQGRLKTPKGYTLWVFTYSRTYTNQSDAVTKIMPADKAFILGTKARMDRYFGPPELLPQTPSRLQMYQELFGFDPRMPIMAAQLMNAEEIINPNMFYCDCYLSGDHKTVTLRTQAAPIFVTTQTDAIVTLNGLITT